MSRRTKAVKRQTPPDPRYDSQTVSKFINHLMSDGKKSTAEKVFYTSMDLIEQRSGQPGVQVFKQALNNVKPMLEVKSRRVGGATYQVPIEVRGDRGMALAMRWLADSARKRSEKSMGMRLAGEILDAIESKGSAVKKREETHRMAEANKAFPHYRW